MLQACSFPSRSNLQPYQVLYLLLSNHHQHHNPKLISQLQLGSTSRVSAQIQLRHSDTHLTFLWLESKLPSFPIKTAVQYRVEPPSSSFSMIPIDSNTLFVSAILHNVSNSGDERLMAESKYFAYHLRPEEGQKLWFDQRDLDAFTSRFSCSDSGVKSITPGVGRKETLTI